MVFEQGKTGIGSTEKLFDMFFTHVGTHRDLGLTLQNIEGDIAKIHLPFQSKHADSIENGSLHTTAIATAIDSACGCAVMLHLGKPAAIASTTESGNCSDREDSAKMSNRPRNVFGFATKPGK